METPRMRIEENTLVTTQAVYIGSGCFIRVRDQKLAFVNKSNRPTNLREGIMYELAQMSIDCGVLYFVKGECK